jgi:hypothetical protein
VRRRDGGRFDLRQGVEHSFKFFVRRDVGDFDSLGWGAGYEQAFIDHHTQGVRDQVNRDLVAFVDHPLAKELSGLDHIAAGLADSGVECVRPQEVTDFSSQCD